MNPDPDIRLSIIIPVYDRLENMRACLNSLAGNQYQGSAEVLVVCDGGPPEMRKLEKEWDGPWPLHWIDLPKGGPAKARNIAVKESRGEIILFLNDDVILEPTVLSGHDNAHRRRPGQAVMGNTRFAHQAVNSEFMHWLAHRDHVVYLIEEHNDTGWEYFHTLNGSIDRSWFEGGEWFDESFPDPAFEDTEFVYRLAKKGLKVGYAGEALAWHNHSYEPRSFYHRNYMRGQSARRFIELHPDQSERITSEYTDAISRVKKRLWLHDLMKRNDGPEEWYARMGMAFMAGMRGKDLPAAVLRG